MPNQNKSNVLVALAGILAVLALLTLLPSSSHTILNDFGYYSLCPFAPWSSLALLVSAGVVWILRGYIKTQRD